MSPTVPPISVITTSVPSTASREIRRLISSVMWGMTCTVLPRYSPASLRGEHRLVDRSRGGVRVAGEVLVDEALVVTEVEVGLSAVLGDEDLTVLEGVHRARIDVDVRIELLHRDLQSPGLEQSAERRGGQPLAQARRDAAGDEDVLGHSHSLVVGFPEGSAGAPGADAPSPTLGALPRRQAPRLVHSVHPTVHPTVHPSLPQPSTPPLAPPRPTRPRAPTAMTASLDTAADDPSGRRPAESPVATGTTGMRLDRLIDVVGLGFLALVLRLPAFLSTRHLTFDDGVFASSVIAMRDGGVPFREVFSSQGPLFLPLVYVGDLLGGRSLDAPRVAAVASGIAATVGLYWCGRQIGGRTAGVLAGVLAATSGCLMWVTGPLAADGPALAFAVFAFGVALSMRPPPQPRVAVIDGSAGRCDAVDQVAGSSGARPRRHGAAVARDPSPARGGHRRQPAPALAPHGDRGGGGRCRARCWSTWW